MMCAPPGGAGRRPGPGSWGRRAARPTSPRGETEGRGGSSVVSKVHLLKGMLGFSTLNQKEKSEAKIGSLSKIHFELKIIVLFSIG